MTIVTQTENEKNTIIGCCFVFICVVRVGIWFLFDKLRLKPIECKQNKSEKRENEKKLVLKR